jgi:hypothetical protein
LAIQPRHGVVVWGAIAHHLAVVLACVSLSGRVVTANRARSSILQGKRAGAGQDATDFK